jgi:hypothetical protein
MLAIEMLPARHGDCLWIEYGEGRARHRILIDGGPGFAYEQGLRARIAALDAPRHFELAVTTHIDADHIEGMIRLLGEPALGVTYGEFWYNAWPQLAGAVEFGAVQGEYLSALVRKQKLRWNESFPAQKGVRTAAATDKLPEIALPGGARLTLLSPGPAELAKLRDVWDEELEAADIEPDAAEEALARLKRDRKFKAHVSFGVEGPDPRALAAAPFSEDTGAPNGSSIGFLLEFGGKSALLLGDAHPAVVVAHLDRLLARRRMSRLAVDAVKLPHHGSQNNVNAALVARVASPHWLFSSDGTFFEHPDPEAVARVVVGGQDSPRLVFNYRTKFTAPWDNADLERRFKYRALYPEKGKAGYRLEL